MPDDEGRRGEPLTLGFEPVAEGIGAAQPLFQRA